MDELYKNIKKRREQIGMSQRELATKCGYTDHTTICKIENGTVDITFGRLKQIAAALDTTIINLIMGDELR